MTSLQRLYFAHTHTRTENKHTSDELATAALADALLLAARVEAARLDHSELERGGVVHSHTNLPTVELLYERVVYSNLTPYRQPPRDRRGGEENLDIV